ncbi:AAA family ATPase [Roseinatronobacter sp.]
MAPSQSPPSFAAYVFSKQARDVAQDTARLGGWSDDNIHGGGLAGAARLVADRPLAQHMIAEIGNESLSQACESVTEIVRSGTRLVVVGQHDSICTYRALRSAGALEYLPFPVRGSDALASLTQKVANADQPVKRALTIGVVGCSGGIGASSLVENLAYVARQDPIAQRVGLLDFDLWFGSMAHDLNQDPTSGLLDALAAPKRVDRTFADASMLEIKDGLFLYSHQARDGQDATELEAGIGPLLDKMSPMFDIMVVDLPRALLLRQPDIAQYLNALVPVMAPGYASINAYSRIMQGCLNENRTLKLAPVLSDLRGGAALRKKQIAHAIGQEFQTTLPLCEHAMIKAQLAGQPVVCMKRGARYSGNVRSLWRTLSAEHRPQRSSFWRSAFQKVIA